MAQGRPTVAKCTAVLIAARIFNLVHAAKIFAAVRNVLAKVTVLEEMMNASLLTLAGLCYSLLKLC